MLGSDDSAGGRINSFPRSGLPDGGGAEPPLDLVHLSRQTQGDAALEDELLRLFRRQSRDLARALSASSSLSTASRADLAHRLRGSALAIGARRVAAAAARIEESAVVVAPASEASASEATALMEAIAALEAIVAEAVAEIDRMIG